MNLSSDSEDKLKIYRENFERAYLEATETFYKQKASEYLVENGVQNYMRCVSVEGFGYVRCSCVIIISFTDVSYSRYADTKLKEEEARANRYLETRKGCTSVTTVSRVFNHD